MKKPELPVLRAEWERIRQIIEERNRKFGALTEEDVKNEIEAHRRGATRGDETCSRLDYFGG
jgi:hypothetical protein